jgi:hypothetical protein
MVPAKNDAHPAELKPPAGARETDPFLTRALTRLVRDVPPFSGRAFFISFVCLFAALDAQLLFR